MMTKLTKRKIVDFLVNVAAFLVLYFSGSGMFALLVIPVACWNYFDGYTRDKIRGES